MWEYVRQHINRTSMGLCVCARIRCQHLESQVLSHVKVVKVPENTIQRSRFIIDVFVFDVIAVVKITTVDTVGQGMRTQGLCY